MEELKLCKLCRGLEGSRPVPFSPGYGEERVLIVGEAPGMEENDSGVPFVGAAGRILNACLQEAGLSRKDFFITNIVKCRPPNNRTPIFEEIQACKKWLDLEIEQIKPTLLVALGATAAEALTGEGLSHRGSIIPSYYNIPCLITYHPAFVMRSRSDFPVLINDLAKIKNRPPQIGENYYYDPPIDLARGLVEKWYPNPIACDIETAGNGGEGLNPFLDVIIGFAASGAPGEAFFYSLNGPSHHERWKLLGDLVEGYDLIWQNNLFDRTFLKAKGLNPKTPVWDTMNAMYVLHSDSEKSLDFLRSLYTSIPPYKKVYRKKGGGAVGHLSPQDLARYNCLDADVTKRVALGQEKDLDKRQKQVLERVLQLDTLAMNMRLRGVPIDKRELANNFLHFQPLVEKYEKEFFDRWQVNPNSPKQLAALLYDDMRMPLPPKRWKKAERSTDEEAIKMLREGVFVQDHIELLDHLLAYREASKLLSTYIQGWWDRIGPDGRIHPEWITTGTDTGRWACRNPNLQNPPESIRNPIVAGEGKILLMGDFRNLEFLIMLICAGDFETAEAVLAGRDIHSEVQEEMAKESPVPPTRLQAKAIVFGTAYGLTPASAARRFKVPVYVAASWQNLCYRKFPKLVALSQKNLSLFKEKGYAESFFGRRKYCEQATQALNHPIQSTGADITHNACLELEERGFNPILNVHDEIVCEIPIPSNPERVVEEFTHILNNACPSLYHCFPCSVRLAPGWQKPPKPSPKEEVEEEPHA